MNIAGLDSLVKCLQDPGLREVLAHPDWEAAYAHMVDNEYDHVEGWDDVGEDAQFVHLFDKYGPWVEGGKIWIEDTVPTEPYFWHAAKGDWFQESDEDEDEDEEEDDDSDE